MASGWGCCGIPQMPHPQGYCGCGTPQMPHPRGHCSFSCSMGGAAAAAPWATVVLAVAVLAAWGASGGGPIISVEVWLLLLLGLQRCWRRQHVEWGASGGEPILSTEELLLVLWLRCGEQCGVLRWSAVVAAAAAPVRAIAPVEEA